MRWMAGAAAGVAIAVLTGCAAGEEPAAAPQQTTGHDTAAPTTAAGQGDTASGDQGDARITRAEITVSDGKVNGPGDTVRVPIGGQVELVVRSDVADEVHVHGFDQSAAVAPGKPATLRFTAVAPGKFEVELERSKLALVELEVR